jgi:uncharacterized tellurite resistance protein B-like protein
MLTETVDSATGKPAERGDDVELATAALLVEMARADFVEESTERELIQKLLADRFDLLEAERGALLGRATQRADAAVSLQEFTRLLHEQLDAEEKLGIVAMLWELSLADGRIDKHEEHLVRKVAGLLYVPDRDMIRVKLRVIEEFEAGESANDPEAARPRGT